MTCNHRELQKNTEIPMRLKSITCQKCGHEFGFDYRVIYRGHVIRAGVMIDIFDLAEKIECISCSANIPQVGIPCQHISLHNIFVKKELEA